MISTAVACSRKLKGYKMTKFLMVILVIILVVVGCNSRLSPDVTNEEMNIKGSDLTADSTRLADVDFVTVPDFIYYVLHEEKLDSNFTHFIRRYVKYDGYTEKVEETLQLIPLPQKCTGVRDAKVRLLAADPEQLALYPHTFL